MALAGTADVVASAAQVVSSWGFSITPDTLNQIASEVGEQLDPLPVRVVRLRWRWQMAHTWMVRWVVNDDVAFLVSLRHSV
ncbi:hypothetical protein ACLB1S_08860 [Escherichia coli]